MSRNTTRQRHLTIDAADLHWIATVLPQALERAQRDTHPGIAPNGLTADDGSHPGPIPQLVATHAVTGDPARRARDELFEALDTIHKATLSATHAIHRLLPLNPTDARALAEHETLEPISTPCTNPHCTNHAETNRTQCRACRAYRARTGHDRGPELTNTDTHNVSTTGHIQNPTNTAPTNA